jgi:hypothetical protein
MFVLNDIVLHKNNIIVNTNTFILYSLLYSQIYYAGNSHAVYHRYEFIIYFAIISNNTANQSCLF